MLIRNKTLIGWLINRNRFLRAYVVFVIWNFLHKHVYLRIKNQGVDRHSNYVCVDKRDTKLLSVNMVIIKNHNQNPNPKIEIKQ